MSLDNQGAAAPATGDTAITEAAQPNAATTDAATGAAEGGDSSQVAPKTFTQTELDDIVRREKSKAEAKAERRVLRTLERVIPQQQPAQSSQPAGDGKPTRVQYADDEGYVDALTDWKLDQRERKAQAETRNTQAQSTAKKTEGLYAEAEKLPGFDREAFDELPLTKPMAEALIDSDVSAKLMHYMAANPAEVERISKLSPARQAAELGKLEVKATEAKPPARSNAPTALEGAKGRTAPGMPDPTDTKAYINWANAQERAAR